MLTKLTCLLTNQLARLSLATQPNKSHKKLLSTYYLIPDLFSSLVQPLLGQESPMNKLVHYELKDHHQFRFNCFCCSSDFLDCVLSFSSTSYLPWLGIIFHFLPPLTCRGWDNFRRGLHPLAAHSSTNLMLYNHISHLIHSCYQILSLSLI